MKKFDWNKPVTRKDCLVVSSISCAIVLLTYASLYYDVVKDWVIEKFQKKY